MMKLGIRCSNTDYAYAILEGARSSPQVVEKNTISFPKGYSRSENLKWFYQEIDQILNRLEIDTITIKGAEALATRDKSFVARVENEAMVFLAASNRGLENVSRKIKSTIAKNLGLKGKAKYLAQLDTSVFPTYAEESTKMQEAILAAWSSME
jgi:Holliday junction resolvasome RuvABC endonuclease subunit